MSHLDNKHIHPFLRGNFAPVTEEFVSHPCEVIGHIPNELLGGQYVRNGGNPVYPPEKGRHYHWFDGDGMLHGVLFPCHPDFPPLYTNRHLATPLITLSLLILRSPIPSIALLISPLSSLPRILTAIIQAFLIALRARMGVLSVANTSVLWWGQGMGSEAEEEDSVDDAMGLLDDLEEDSGPSTGSRSYLSVAPGRPGLQRSKSTFRNYRKDHRLLATCESGPPLEVRVPELETVGWERFMDSDGEDLTHRRGNVGWWKRWGMPRVQEDWMTAHPRVDPVDGSLILYSTQMFDNPGVRYSVIDRRGDHLVWKEGIDVGRAKMMHDFAATRTHTILLNLPLTLSPANFLSAQPLIHFDRTLPSEFIVFPRLLRSAQTPQEPIRFQDPEASLIFHTANSWDEVRKGQVVAINMLGCRFRSAQLVYSAGAIEVPKVEKVFGEDDVVRLHYYRFELPPDYYTTNLTRYGTISHSFPLTAIPFEFPTNHPELAMSRSRFVYGCTMGSGSFDERLGGAAKVDCLVKIDVLSLVQQGLARGEGKIMRPVDERSSAQVMDDWRRGKRGSVEIFQLPEGWYAQEPRFVPKKGAKSEDDGYLLSYVYDEHLLMDDGTPSMGSHTGSELWIIDAKRMGDGMDSLVARIKLPQRVPYGLHGTWLPPTLTRHQRPLNGTLAPQTLLQDKLALSRIQHFVSIIFTRPTSRDKSRFERAFLAILWPMAFMLLALAGYDVGKGLIKRDSTSSPLLQFGENITAANPAHQNINDGSRFSWTLTIVALLTIAGVIFIKSESHSHSREPPEPPFQEVEKTD